jgi:hypothetical protein
MTAAARASIQQWASHKLNGSKEVFDPFTVALDPPVKACQVNCAV